MMSASHSLFLLVAAALFACGFRGVFCANGALRKIIAINVMGNGVFMAFIALGAETRDPIPKAMVLTGIVVAVCATGLGSAVGDSAAGGRTVGHPPGCSVRNWLGSFRLCGFLFRDGLVRGASTFGVLLAALALVDGGPERALSFL